MTTTPPPDRTEQARVLLQHIADLQQQVDDKRNAAIVEAARAGMFHQEIADILGITRRTVGRIVTAANEAAQQPVVATDDEHGE